jgi:tetratricopeptide (TPR) repeat protein
MPKYAICLLFYLATFYAHAQSRSLDVLLDDAFSLFMQGSYKEAREIYEKVVQKDATNKDAYLGLARTAMELREFKEAKYILTQSLDKFPVDDEVFYYLGNLFYYQEAYDSAIWCYQQSIRIDDGISMYYSDKADAHLELDQFSIALQSYKKALELDVQNELAWYGAGTVYYYLQMYDSSRFYLSRAININPMDPDFYYQRAMARNLSGDALGALKDLNFCIELDTMHLEAFLERGRIYLNFDEIDSAFDDLFEAYAIDTTHLDVLGEIGNLYLSELMFEDAIDAYSAILEIDRFSDIALYNLGLAYLYHEDAFNALKNFQKAIEIAPEEVNYHLGKANAYLQMKDEKNAIESFLFAVELDENNMEAVFNLAMGYAGFDKFKEAHDLLEQIEQTEPEYPGLYFQKANIAMEIGLFAESLKDYDLAIIDNPQNPLIFFRRGILLYEIDELQGAIEDFSHAIRLEPDFPNPYVNRGLIKMELKDKEGACLDWKKAFQLGSPYAQELLKTNCRKR